MYLRDIRRKDAADGMEVETSVQESCHNVCVDQSSRLKGSVSFLFVPSGATRRGFPRPLRRERPEVPVEATARG